MKLLRRRHAAVWKLRSGQANFSTDGYEGRDHVGGKKTLEERLKDKHPEYLPEKFYKVEREDGLITVKLSDAPSFGIPETYNGRKLRLSQVQAGGERVDFTVVVFKECEKNKIEEVDSVKFGFMGSYDYDDRRNKNKGWVATFYTGGDVTKVPDQGEKVKRLQAGR